MEMELSDMTKMVAKLREMKLRTSGPEMDKAIRAGARVIKAAVQERAPVLDKKTPGSSALDPGALQRGIRVYVPKDVKPTEAHIGPSKKVAYVARFVEYGHRQVHGGYSKVLPGGKTRGPGIAAEKDVPAYPFIRPAYEESLSAAEAAIVESIKQSIKEQVG
jgi:HK97 gp10 family phage protein